MENNEVKTNKGLLVCIIIIALLSFSCGAFASLYFNEINNKQTTEENTNNNSNSNIENNTNSESNTTNEEKKEEEPKKEEDYVGAYKSTDHCDGCIQAYIKLNNDNTYERNHNDCSAMSTIVGEYKVTKSGNDTTITFTSARYQDGLAINNPTLFSFKFKDNKLSVIDDTNTYAYYDCSNSRTFKK